MWKAMTWLSHKMRTGKWWEQCLLLAAGIIFWMIVIQIVIRQSNNVNRKFTLLKENMDTINVRGTEFKKTFDYANQGSFTLTGIFGQVKGGGAILAEAKNERGEIYWVTSDLQPPPGPIVDQWREAIL